jgi:hypothetical protein
VGFRVGLFAVRATETAQPISVCSEALTIDIASRASHCFSGFCCVHHGFNIQRALAVGQEESAKQAGNVPLLGLAGFYGPRIGCGILIPSTLAGLWAEGSDISMACSPASSWHLHGILLITTCLFSCLLNTRS